MRYIILKGGLISVDQLPAKQTEAEAIAEVARLEAIRAKNNARYEEGKNSPHYKGKSFTLRSDRDEWSYTTS